MHSTYKIKIICNRLSSSACFRHGYSTFASSCSPVAGAEFQQISSFVMAHTRPIYAPVVLLRRFTAAMSCSEHMSHIKQLREITGAPMKDVKAALVDFSWDIEAALKELWRRGLVLASKNPFRTAAKGWLALAQNDSKAAVIELNCETDQITKNETFQHLALSLAKLALLDEGSSQQVSGAFPVDPESLEDLKLNIEDRYLRGEKSVKDTITELVALWDENIRFRRCFTILKTSPGFFYTYLHSRPQPGLGSVAGILTLEVDGTPTSLDTLQVVGQELAMQVAAAKPSFLTKDLVSSYALESEREILKSQAEASGKPKMEIEKMVEDRLRKYYEEAVLMEQKCIVNETVTVKTLLDNISEVVGSPVKISSFFRMKVGEGIESCRVEASKY